MRMSKQAVVFWGLVCIGAAYLFGGSDSPVIEIINAIGSVFYGPILATFVLAIFSKKVTSRGMNSGIIIAVLVNLIFSKTIQEIFGLDFGFHVFWMWLNFTGFIIAVAVAYLVSILKPEPIEFAKTPYNFKDINFFNREPIILMIFFVAILTLCFLIPSFLG